MKYFLFVIILSIAFSCKFSSGSKSPYDIEIDYINQIYNHKNFSSNTINLFYEGEMFVDTNIISTIFSEYNNGIELCQKYVDTLSYDKQDVYSRIYLFHHINSDIYFKFAFDIFKMKNVYFGLFDALEGKSCEEGSLRTILD
jgi:hypothetical protein